MGLYRYVFRYGFEIGGCFVWSDLRNYLNTIVERSLEDESFFGKPMLSRTE